MPRRFQFHPALLAAGAVLLGAFLRFFRLTALAPEAWFDEIWFALRARELVQHPALIVFYKTPWGGGNALMVYLTAAVRLLGFTGLSDSRFASAALGVLAVPLAYACFGELLRGSGLPARRWTAAIAALILSYLLYWVVVARVGTEPSLAPAAALFCVWQLKLADRALAAGSRRAPAHYLAAGLVAGIAQYNGPHARFVLPLVALIGLHDLVRSPAARRARAAAGYAGAAAAALLAAAPLIAFFVREPEWFFARARITTVGAGSPLTDPAEMRRNLWFLSISFNFMGSFDPLTNYPGLPMFDPIQSLGWAVGHAWALWNLRRMAAARELLAWEGLMTLPSLLTSDAPNFQRMIGAAAPAACLVALGWVLTLRWMLDQAHKRGQAHRPAPTSVVIGPVGATRGVAPHRAGARPAPTRPSSRSESALGQAHLPTPTGAGTRPAPTGPPLRSESALGQAHLPTPTGAGARPAPTGPPLRSESVFVSLAGVLLLGLGLVVSPLYQAYTLLVRYPALSILPVSYLNAPVRVGRELAARAAAGERVFVSRHPEDADAQNDVIAFEFLFPGTPVERLDFRQCLPLTDGRAARTNYLVLTDRDKHSVPDLYAAYPGSRVTEAYYWQDSGTWLEMPPGAPGPRPPIASRARFDPGLTLLGYEWSGDSIPAGQSLFVTLWWRADADLATDYTSFIHVGTQAVVAQRDGQPCQGLFPTSHWRAGDLVRDSFAITLPPDAPPGTYPLAVGWYTYPDFTRLHLAEADRALPDDRAIIGAITVTP